ncbi:hypothetical protein BGX38DRAFT_1143172 [Terfezia claveryi]|nr:hypothetical protein BGX38DRAFT_1143172 [Terfezia claveryi]
MWNTIRRQGKERSFRTPRIQNWILIQTYGADARGSNSMARNARDPTPGRRDARIQRHGAGTPGIQHHGAGTTWYNRIASRRYGSNGMVSGRYMSECYCQDAIGLDDAVRRHRMCTAGVERQSGRPDVKGPDDGAWEPGIETMAFQIVSLPIEAPAAPET